jgi:hypothetical protein
MPARVRVERPVSSRSLYFVITRGTMQAMATTDESKPATDKTSGKARNDDVLLSVPLKVARKQDAGTGDERKFSIEFGADTADADGVHTLFVSGTVDGDTADRLELAVDYVLEVRRA